MSSEQIRLILSEVEKFLSETLKKESKLSKKTVEHKQQLLDKIQKLYEENPQLKPVPSQDTISVPDESSNTGGTEGSSRSDGSEETQYNDAGIGLIPAADLKSPVFSGFLEKKQKKGAGLFAPKFQRRWCIVQAGIFYYYANQKDKQQHGSFMLEGYKFRNAPDLSSKKAEKELCFELYQDNEAKRAYQFMAKTKADYEQWQDVIATGGYPLIEEDIYEPVDDLERIPDVDIKVDDPGEEYEEPDAPIRPPPPPSPISLQKTLPPLPPPPPPVVEEVTEAPDDVYDDASSVMPEAEELPPPPPPINSKPPHVEAPPPPPPEVPPSLKKRPQRDLPPPPPEKKKIKISLPFKPQEDFENRFYGKWDCTGDSTNELTFKKGDIIHVLSREFDDKAWWVGELEGKFGLVPKNFLTPAYTPVA